MFLFRLITSVISIYTLLCIIRIVLTWLPDLNYSAFGQFLSRVCDPYLNLFRKIRFLQIGAIDFSPIVAIGVLSIGSSLINQMLFYGGFSVAYLLASIIQVCWTAISSILTIYNILLLIRLIVALLKKDYSSSLWSNLDRIIYPVQSRVTSIIFKNKIVSNKMGLGITLAACILFQIVGSWIFGLVAKILTFLPF
jgi:YggT family protein